MLHLNCSWYNPEAFPTPVPYNEAPDMIGWQLRLGNLSEFCISNQSTKATDEILRYAFQHT